jgi:hypothetical protein
MTDSVNDRLAALVAQKAAEQLSDEEYQTVLAALDQDDITIRLEWEANDTLTAWVGVGSPPVSIPGDEARAAADDD